MSYLSRHLPRAHLKVGSDSYNLLENHNKYQFSLQIGVKKVTDLTRDIVPIANFEERN
jgi:hypothetical protein